MNTHTELLNKITKLKIDRNYLRNYLHKVKIQLSKSIEKTDIDILYKRRKNYIYN